jgi:hypothetical protein
MAAHGDPPAKAFIRNVLTDPEEYLKFGGGPRPGDLFTCRELAESYAQTSTIVGGSPNLHALETQIGIQIRVLKAPFIHLHKKDCGADMRLYAIRHRDEWHEWIRKLDGVAIQIRALRARKDAETPYLLGRGQRARRVLDVVDGKKKASTTPTTP